MGSEAMEDMLINEHVRNIQNYSRTTWTTRDGEVLKITEMETSHITNVIAMCNRKGIAAPALMYQVLKIRESIKGKSNVNAS